MKTYNTGRFKWQYGQENDPRRGWDGKSLHCLLGPCPRCGNCTEEYGGGFQCLNSSCYNNANNFACSNDGVPDWWNTDINVQLDGASWCAYRDGFINLQESDAGFGNTPQAAVDALLDKEKAREAYPECNGTGTINNRPFGDTEIMFGDLCAKCNGTGRKQKDLKESEVVPNGHTDDATSSASPVSPQFNPTGASQEGKTLGQVTYERYAYYQLHIPRMEIRPLTWEELKLVNDGRCCEEWEDIAQAAATRREGNP